MWQLAIVFYQTQNLLLTPIHILRDVCGDPDSQAAEEEDGGRHAPHHHALPAGRGGPGGFGGEVGELVLLERCQD